MGINEKWWQKKSQLQTPTVFRKNDANIRPKYVKIEKQNNIKIKDIDRFFDKD